MKKRLRAKRLRAFVAVLCTFALVMMPVLPAWGDTTSGDMVASDQQNVSVGSGKRINSFNLNNTFSYESLGGDSDSKPTLTLSTSALQNIVKNKLLPQWSGVAASVFRDQAGQLVDLYGYQNNGGNMSQAGFDAYFNMSASGNEKYKDEVWSCYSLSQKLGQTWATHVGDPGWDQFTVSGVKKVENLNQARNMVGQALYDCEGHKGLEAHEFLDVDEAGYERLDALKSEDQTTGFVNLVTAVNCKGSSADFDYVTFGIVFYDFEPVPVAAKGLQYQSTKLDVSTNEKGHNDSTVTNGQQQEIVHSAVLGDSVTETTSTTISALASAKLSQNIGANISWSETDFSSETNPTEGENPGSETSGSASTTTMGLNWGAAWELAGAAGVEKGHSQSKEVSKAVETTIAIPPHTATTIDTTTTATTYTQNYQQPVILNYKVALFATSGDFYAGGSGGISPGRYDKQSLVIKFDTKGEANPTYGCAATDDLFSRAITNVNVNDYDVANGRTYSSHSNANGWSKSENIDWSSVRSNAQSYYGVDLVNGVAKKNFFYETPGKLNVEQDKTTSAVQSTYPMYDLAAVTVPKTKYVLYNGNTLDKKALNLEGYNKSGVPFFGFASNYPLWGEWKVCNDKGVIRGDGSLLADDPVELNGTELVPKTTSAQGGTIYLRWVFNNLSEIEDPAHPKAKERPKTGEHPKGQDLTLLNTKTPIVEIQVMNSALDDPRVRAEGSYTGFYGTPINLNKVLAHEVTDDTDKKIDTQVMWESRELPSEGIGVSAGTGNAVFTKPGIYHVRPYVMKNANSEGKVVKAYPVDSFGEAEWITITATEHNLVHYDAKTPTDCTGGDAYGWKEHYRCSACGKYFSDAAGTIEVPEADVIIDPPGHDWGEWVTIKEATDAEPGLQQRVCKNRDSHVETRNLYTVKFDLNGKEGTAPEKQIVATGSSVTVPAEPKAAGQTFEGWYTDKDGNNLYDFGSAVDSNLTLYAKWTPVKYTVATTAVVFTTGDDGQQKIRPATGCSVSLGDGQTTESDTDGYSYSYMEVEYDKPVTLTVSSGTNYSFTNDGKNIQAAPVMSETSIGDSIELTPGSTGSNTYSFTMPAADVAVVANFNQDQVTVTYDGNKPADAPESATVTVSNVPPAETINNGSTPANLGTVPTIAITPEPGYTYSFGGWYKDSACTQPFLSNSKVTQDTMLYAKWTKVATHTVTYRLSYPEGTAPDEVSYQAEDNSAAYDPTNDLYAIVGEAALAQYELQKDASGACWFKDEGCTTAYDFTQPVTNDLNLYAKVIPRTYTVTYYDGEQQLGTQGVTYDNSIGTLDEKVKTTKDGCTLAGWVTKDGVDWAIATSPVKSDLALYAIWNIDVTFDANGHGTAPAVQTVKSGEKVTKPSDLTAEGYTFGGWYTDATCSDDKAYNFDTAVTEPLTLYAKWTAEKRTVTFDANGHGTAPTAQTVDYNSNAAKPADPTADGYTFGGWYKEAACITAYDFAAPVTGDLKLYAKWTEAVVPVPDPVSEGVEMYRLYNPNSGEHFYTGNAGERDAVVAAGWSYEGVGWTAPTTSNTPVYRLYNANGGEHHYTMSEVERDMLVGVGWSYEDIGWYSDDEQRVPLYRDYNPYAFANNHNYTTSVAEHDMLMGVGWRPEGYAWYAIK